MVSNITSLTGNGLKDWLIQRITAVYIGAYALFLLAFFILNPSFDYAKWHSLFNCLLVEIASVLMVFCILLHAWVGIWTVTTDYLKCTKLRVLVQVLVFFYLSALFLWALHIFWGA